MVCLFACAGQETSAPGQERPAVPTGPAIPASISTVTLYELFTQVWGAGVNVPYIQDQNYLGSFQDSYQGRFQEDIPCELGGTLSSKGSLARKEVQQRAAYELFVESRFEGCKMSLQTSQGAFDVSITGGEGIAVDAAIFSPDADALNVHPYTESNGVCFYVEGLEEFEFCTFGGVALATSGSTVESCEGSIEIFDRNGTREHLNLCENILELL